MKKNRSILKTLCLTAGLNILLVGDLYLFSRLVDEELGQALLFLSVTLLLTTGLCLFARVPAGNRRELWARMGVAVGVHLPLSTAAAFTGGTALSNHWPGGTGDNLAALLLLLMSLTVWLVGVFWITVIRSAAIGHTRWEKKRQVKRALKGFTKEYPPLSPARAILLSILRGTLWVVWLHVLTTLLMEWLVSMGLEETMLSYLSFPVLWGLMAAVYGLLRRPSPVAFTLSAAVTNLLLFILPSFLLAVANTPVHKYRLVLHLDSVLNEPFQNPDQMLVIGVFLTVWTAIIVFGRAQKKKTVA